MFRLLSFSYEKIIFLFSASSCGILLFIMLFSFIVNNTILNSSYHKYLFKKNDISTHVKECISTSMKSFLEDAKKLPTQVPEEQEKLFLTIEKSITPELIDFNLYNIRENLFLYFRDQKVSLPDILLDRESTVSKASENESIEKINDAIETFNKLKKINIKTILVYLNRYDIIDGLAILKMATYFSGYLPELSFIAFLFLSILNIIFCKTLRDSLKWCKTLVTVFTVLCTLSGFFILMYTLFIMPANVFPLSMSIPLPKEVIINYIKSALMPLFITQIFLGGTLSFLLLYKIPIENIIRKIFPENLYLPFSPNIKFMKIIKGSLYLMVISLISIIFSHDIYKIQDTFIKNDFNYFLSKLQKNYSVTQVISAKTDGIFVLNVNIVDKNTNSPIYNVPINVSGKSSESNKYFNEVETTDKEGTTKFNLAKGSFRISFINSYFPHETYELPSAYFFELRKAGSTIVTIELQRKENLKSNIPGITEIEVLGKDDTPLSNIKLMIKNISSESNIDNSVLSDKKQDLTKKGTSLEPTTNKDKNPDIYYSYTNSEGIAVFKLKEGLYKISFSESKINKQYELPQDFEVSVVPNSTLRYSIKLTSH